MVCNRCNTFYTFPPKVEKSGNIEINGGVKEKKTGKYKNIERKSIAPRASRTPTVFQNGGSGVASGEESVWGMGRMEVILWHRVIPHTMENTTFRSGTATRFVSIIPHLVQECQPPYCFGGYKRGGWR